MTVLVDRRIERSRAAILSGATAVFLRNGYDGTSVDDIAREAGVAKRTVYNIFEDKEALFRETVSAAIEIAERFSAELSEETELMRDVAADLPRIARRLASAVLAGPVLDLRRLVVSESRRFPELAVEYRRRAPELVMRALSSALRKVGDSGKLRIDNADVAAEHFAFLIMGADLDRGMFSVAVGSERRIRERADAGTAVFLRAYAV
ncbi:MAG: TetR/AcrR family transcriptional regulator [Micrococcales bacterium]|nr:TetR/AcrR family transcriptional regulator [Micrococcales bacterium]